MQLQVRKINNSYNVLSCASLKSFHMSLRFFMGLFSMGCTMSCMKRRSDSGKGKWIYFPGSLQRQHWPHVLPSHHSSPTYIAKGNLSAQVSFAHYTYTDSCKYSFRNRKYRSGGERQSVHSWLFQISRSFLILEEINNFKPRGHIRYGLHDSQYANNVQKFISTMSN